MTGIAALSPNFTDFERQFAAGAPQVVWRRRVDDLETPVSAFIKLAADQPNAFLLESVQGGDWRGRYSVIGLEPDLIWRAHGPKAQCAGGDGVASRDYKPEAEPTLESLRQLIETSAIDLPAELPPMAAGLFGYLGYDMVRLAEHLPNPNMDPLGLPDAVMLRPTLVVVFDSVAQELLLVTPVRPQAGDNAAAAYEAAQTRLDRAENLLDGEAPKRLKPTRTSQKLTDPVSNTTPERYREMVEQAVEYIKAGDAFQIVPSQRFSTPLPAAPFALYRSLRRLNPSPFLYYFNIDEAAVVGSSPEILVRLREGKVSLRPLAGTRPRGATPQEDAALEAELLADPKELAEHLMLLDLGRNDVGRVSKAGTVKVSDAFTVERYSHVMHIVSHVDGELSDEHDALSALIAGFPAGTLSGAPKVRAMEIIDELEQHRRGLYAGSLGYISARGEMDTAIVLRTAIIKDGVMHVQAGAGVVADSDPETERMETIHKAEALFRAARDAVQYE